MRVSTGRIGVCLAIAALVLAAGSCRIPFDEPATSTDGAPAGPVSTSLRAEALSGK